MEKNENSSLSRQKFLHRAFLWILISYVVLIGLTVFFFEVFLSSEVTTQKGWLAYVGGLIFFVGAVVAGLGAFVGGGLSESMLAHRGGYNPHSTRQIMFVDERIKQREKQMSFGMRTMIIGVLAIFTGIILFLLA